MRHLSNLNFSFYIMYKTLSPLAGMNRNMRVRFHQQGFTLIEIMLVLMIFVLLASLGIPAYGDLASRHRLNAATVQVVSDLMLARKRALSQRHMVQLLFDSTQRYRIWDYRNDNQKINRKEIQSKDMVSFGVEIVSNNHPRFYPSGSVTNLPTIKLKHPNVPSQYTRCITISITGRIKQRRCAD